MTCQKYLLTVKFSQVFFCLQTFLWKQKLGKHRAQPEFFKFFITKNNYIRTDEFAAIRQQLTTVMLWEFFLLSLSLLKVIWETQSIFF